MTAKGQYEYPTRDPKQYAGVDVEKFLRLFPQYDALTPMEFGRALIACGAEVVKYDPWVQVPTANEDGLLRIWQPRNGVVDSLWEQVDTAVLRAYEKALKQ